MIQVYVARDEADRWASIHSTGHADGLKASPVCTAISTLMFTGWLALRDVAGLDVTPIKTEGDLALGWAESDRGNAVLSVVLATIVGGMRQIESQFPDQVKVTIGTVEETVPECPRLVTATS